MTLVSNTLVIQGSAASSDTVSRRVPAGRTRTEQSSAITPWRPPRLGRAICLRASFARLTNASCVRGRLHSTSMNLPLDRNVRSDSESHVAWRGGCLPQRQRGCLLSKASRRRGNRTHRSGPDCSMLRVSHLRVAEAPCQRTALNLFFEPRKAGDPLFPQLKYVNNLTALAVCEDVLPRTYLLLEELPDNLAVPSSSTAFYRKPLASGI